MDGVGGAVSDVLLSGTRHLIHRAVLRDGYVNTAASGSPRRTSVDAIPLMRFR